MKLYTKILIGMLAGIVAGLLLNQFGGASLTQYTDPIGDLFIRLVKMMVVPMVLVSLVLGAASLGDIRKIGRLGGRTLAIFTITTMFAAIIGIFAADLLRPGAGMGEAEKSQLLDQYASQAEAVENKAEEGKSTDKNAFLTIVNMFVKMVPTNPIKALADGDMLAVIVFALFLGLTITLIEPAKSATLIRGFDGLNDAIIKMITLAMEIAPYGVFALMANVTANLGFGVLLLLIKYGLVVVLGLIIHVGVVYSGMLYFIGKVKPLLFFRAIKEALVMGFSTSSSSATLPISMNVAETNLGISRKISSFVLPMGATINMDGTCLYQAVAAIFIAQVFNMDLTLMQQATIVLTATLASVGAAGVPGAGMITLALVLDTLGIPAAGLALIFGLDRILDMCRTTVNIVGDLTMTVIIARLEGETFEVQVGKDLVGG